MNISDDYSHEQNDNTNISDNIDYKRFKEGNLRKEVSKILTIKTTQFQFDIIQKLAKIQNKTIKGLLLDYVAEVAKQKGIL